MAEASFKSDSRDGVGCFQREEMMKVMTSAENSGGKLEAWT